MFEVCVCVFVFVYLESLTLPVTFDLLQLIVFVINMHIPWVKHILMTSVLTTL